ncbi:protein hairy [Adelges cooleyi]|uniref:protein hairy n=1 Tax=Adelges cooleyi TaxID=133065 RepID=UPI00217F95B1|nr:protein hairy [Adelges cooleyi]
MTSGVAATEGSPLSADTICSQKKTNENNRRSNKPIMEKKRRARINNCLNELKSLILDATKKDPARHSKLEKADILEMTVKHLETMQKQGVALSAATDSTVANKFKAGFSECTNEVSRFPGLEPNVRKRLIQHLSTYFTKENGGGVSEKSPRPPSETANLQLHLDSNQNAILLGTTGSTCGVQLVPTRLPNGDIALVLPSRSAEQTTAPPPPHPMSLVMSPTPPSTRSESSGTDSPNPDRPSSCYSMGSCDSSDAYSQSDLPLALVTRRDEEKSILEEPWRPW